MTYPYDIRSEFYTFETDRCGNNGIGLAIYYPEKITDKAKIAVIAMHASSYMGFTPMVNMARCGYIAAGISAKGRRVEDLMHAMNLAINFVKEHTPAEKVVLMAHSQGGCALTCYQYIAENGTERFDTSGRFIPFPEIEKLTPADGMLVLDGNYGIMSMLALDPAVRVMNNGYSRIPGLDIFNPENGYRPGGSVYTEDFIRDFQKAQVQEYRELFAYCQYRYDAIRAGRGRFRDDEPLLIPGGAGGSSNNKPFCMDIRLLGRTAKERTLLHPDGTTTTEVVYTNRLPVDSVSSEYFHRGAQSTTVMSFLRDEMRFSDDFGYDECSMWGIDENFLYYSTRENVRHIHVPMLFQGNSASHEFVNMEMSYENSVSEDKEYFVSLGSCHDYAPVSEEFTGILDAVCAYFDQWLSRPGRFLG